MSLKDIHLLDDGTDQPIVLNDVIVLLGVGSVTSVVSEIETSTDVLLLVDRDGSADDVVASAESSMSRSSSQKTFTSSSGQVGRSLGGDSECRRQSE
jgi:hypothetical protein